MKQAQLAALASAILTAMGIFCAWGDLRFSDVIPSGIKLMMLFLLICLWLAQFSAEISSKTEIARKIGLISTGVAAAFYGLCAVETFRMFLLYHQPTVNWIMLLFSVAAAFAITILLLMSAPESNDCGTAGKGQKQ